ncbi:hypothetical protein F4V89_12860 [Neorhizobium galegae]|nr:hypothetical protein F4V89_12860 [Neorhizobium galegae]
MARPRPSPGQEKLAQIRARHQSASAVWLLVPEGNRMALAVPAADDGEPDMVAVFTETAGHDELEFFRHAHEDMSFVLRQLDRATGRIEDLYRKYPDERPKAPPNYAGECAMKCQNDAAFRRYLMVRHDLHDASDAERIKTRVRSILAVSSLRELNEDPQAAARWQSLRTDFSAWMRDAR